MANSRGRRQGQGRSNVNNDSAFAAAFVVAEAAEPTLPNVGFLLQLTQQQQLFLMPLLQIMPSHLNNNDNNNNNSSSFNLHPLHRLLR